MHTIIFDVDDTLYDQALSFHKTCKKILGEQLTLEQINKLYKSNRKYSEILFDQSERGIITELEWQLGRIIKACQDFGIVMDQEKAMEFHKMYVAEQNKISLFDEIKELLDHLLAQGKQLAILTNGEAQHQSMKIEQLELTKWIPEEHIFISGVIGYAKPKREVFEFIEKKLELDKTETVYVGDNYEKDIVGAKQVGWQAIWMNHRKRKLDNQVTIKPDIEVHSANELLQCLSSSD